MLCETIVWSCQSTRAHYTGLTTKFRAAVLQDFRPLDIDFKAFADQVMRRCDEIAALTDQPGAVHRLFCSPAIKQACELVGSWMEHAGLTVHLDAACNLIGQSGSDNRKLLLIGSHIDTVPNGGKYDGALGIVLGVAMAEMFRDRFQSLPFRIGIVAFSEEEGVRYRSPYIGSKAIAGQFDQTLLSRLDDEDISCGDAINAFGGDAVSIEAAIIHPDNILAYFEPHIEQGPVLESKGLAVAIVDGIAGQSRATARFVGRSAHAGTTPMNLRHDAMAASAEWILAVEAHAKQTLGLVATVGYVQVTPNVPNVIAGDVGVRLDARHLDDNVRRESVESLKRIGEQIALRRQLEFRWERCEEQSAVRMDAELIDTMEQAFQQCQQPLCHMPSGAGHDAVIMSKIARSAMLFIRCKGGISHHPDESVTTKDIETTLQVMHRFIDRLTMKALVAFR
jgi:allantoate deiminase